MDHHLGYESYERSDNTNARNRHKPKSVRSKYGEVQVKVSQYCGNSFDSQIICKYQKEISKIDDKIIAMYAKSLITRQISE